MRLYFIRHGESEANILREISNRGRRHPLTATGRAQAAALADRLRDAGISRLYSSPLLRATETADILAAAWGIDYQVTDALREFDCGIVEGRSDIVAWDAWRGVVAAWRAGRWDSRIEGGESLEDIRDRFVPFVTDLATHATDDQDAVALIGHGGLYYTVMPLALVNVDRAWVEAQELPNTAIITVEARADGLWCVDWAGVAPLR